MTTIKIIDFNGQNSDGGETYTVEVNGVLHTYEVWSTESSSGAEWYRDGATVEPPFVNSEGFIDEEANNAFEALLEKFDFLYYPLWQDRVRPVIDAITAEVLAQVNA